MSNSPFEEVNKVFLDYRSMTSVNLVKVLAKNILEKGISMDKHLKTLILNRVKK